MNLPISNDVLYLSLVALFTILGAGFIQFRLRKLEQERFDRIQGLRRFVPTQLPEPDDDLVKFKKTKKEAIEKIATRFTLFRRILVPLFILFCGVIAIIPFMGRIPATFVSIFLGAITVLLGITAKPALENIASGLVLSFSQPIRIGDIVTIDQTYGIVEEIGVTHTVIKKWDWSRLVVPNSKMIQTNVLNYTLQDRLLWASVSFWVDTKADLRKVKEISLEVAKGVSDKIIENEHEPGFWVMEQKQEATLCWLAAWVDHPVQAWSVRTEMLTLLSEKLNQHGIASHGYQIYNDIARPVPANSESFHPSAPA